MSDIQAFHHAADVTWDKESPANLYLLTDEQTFTGALFDKVKQKFVQVSSFHLNSSGSLETLAAILDEYFAGWQRYDKFILPCDLRTTLVPEALYESDKKESFFRISNKLMDNDRLFVNYLPHLRTFCISAWPASVAYQFELHFPGAHIYHQATPWLESLFLLQKNRFENNTYVNVFEGGIFICVFKDRHLQLFNSFPCNSAEDMLYFVLFVSEQLDIKPHKDQYYLSGKIKREDETHKLFSKYINELNFIRRPEQYQYSLTLNTLPEHQYFITYSTPLCV